MTTLTAFRPRRVPPAFAVAILASPAVAVFVSSNLVNVGNLAFNMIFSRWMGPELYGDLALVLTIKLTLLGVMGAVQMGVSQMIARTSGGERDGLEQGLARIARVSFLAFWVGLPVATGLILGASLGARLGLSGPHLLLILLAALPFSAPLSILRGVAFGHLSTRRIVVSANVEMTVRLAGAVMAWRAGFGIEGVVAAIALSIVASWAILADLLPRAVPASVEARPILLGLAVASLPLALLQVAQTLSLDGDIFLASAYLSDHDTGLVSALSLFQRIQFYACFTLAGVLLPSVVSALRDGRSIVTAAAPVALVFLAVATTVIAASLVAPETIVTLLVGRDFAAAADGLLLAAASSVAFTMSYLLATFLAAIGDRRGLYAAAAAALAQIGLMAVALKAPDAGIFDLLTIKAALQGALAAGLLLFTAGRLVRFRPLPTTR